MISPTTDPLVAPTPAPTPAPEPTPTVATTWRAKRCFDLAVSVPLAIASAPLVAALAIGSAISFRSWPFFSQQRVGRDGEPFHVIKVRSLPTDSPRYADKYAIGEIPNTRWGRFIRRCHLDEVPQLWLVVTGRMSLVGPRPEMAELTVTYDPTFVATRNLVRPGMTGLWQISVAQDGLIGEAPEYDTAYVHQGSFRLDLWVLWRTVIDLTTSQGSIELDDIPHW